MSKLTIDPEAISAQIEYTFKKDAFENILYSLENGQQDAAAQGNHGTAYFLELLRKHLEAQKAQKALGLKDRVLTAYHGPGEIRALDGEEAWIALDSGRKITYEITLLERA